MQLIWPMSSPIIEARICVSSDLNQDFEKSMQNKLSISTNKFKSFGHMKII
jgi:hypothetical protein